MFGVTPGIPLSCPIASLPFARFFFIALRLVSRIDSFLDGVQPIVAFLIFVFALRYELSGEKTLSALPFNMFEGNEMAITRFSSSASRTEYSMLTFVRVHIMNSLRFLSGFVIADLLIRTNTFASQKHYRSTTLVRYPPQKASIKLRGEIVIYIKTKSCPNFTTIIC